MPSGFRHAVTARATRLPDLILTAPRGMGLAVLSMLVTAVLLTALGTLGGRRAEGARVV